MIQEATAEDLPKIAACARRFYSESPLLADLVEDKFCEAWDGLIKSGAGISFIEYSGDEVAGGIGAVRMMDPYGSQVIASEAFWFVRPEARGSLGIRLYQRFERWAKDNGVDTIQMIHLMDAGGEKAKKFYERIGYEPVEVRYQKRLAA